MKATNYNPHTPYFGISLFRQLFYTNFEDLEQFWAWDDDIGFSLLILLVVMYSCSLKSPSRKLISIELYPEILSVLVPSCQQYQHERYVLRTGN
jgi:hypothetical protein